MEAETDVEDVAEQRAPEKADLVQEGMLRRARFRNGGWHDVAMFSRLRDEWRFGGLVDRRQPLRRPAFGTIRERVARRYRTGSTTVTERPPMNPDTDEATARQLELARRQGDAYGAAVQHMVGDVAEGGAQQQAGDYLIGVAVEEAEGLYVMKNGDLVWQEPEGNLHVEVAVRDAADGRFVPGLDVIVTIFDDGGNELGTHGHDMVWHPMMYHYAHNWELPGDGTYSMQVDVGAAPFRRHDEVNGRRFAEGVSARFDGIEVTTGRD